MRGSGFLEARVFRKFRAFAKRSGRKFVPCLRSIRKFLESDAYDWDSEMYNMRNSDRKKSEFSGTSESFYKKNHETDSEQRVCPSVVIPLVEEYISHRLDVERR